MFYHDVQRIKPPAEYDRGMVGVTVALLALGAVAALGVLYVGVREENARLEVANQQLERFQRDEETLRAAREWLVRYFDLGTPEAARIREEIESLATIDVDPPRPAVGTAAQALRRVVQGRAATP